MDAAASSPPGDREARFDACLERLEELKSIKARREVLEERVFLEFLAMPTLLLIISQAAGFLI